MGSQMGATVFTTYSENDNCIGRKFGMTLALLRQAQDRALSLCSLLGEKNEGTKSVLSVAECTMKSTKSWGGRSIQILYLSLVLLYSRF